MLGDLIGAVQQGPALDGVTVPEKDAELVRKLDAIVACVKRGWLPELSDAARGWLVDRAHLESIEFNRPFIEYVFTNYGIEIISTYLRPRRGPKRGAKKGKHAP